MGADSIKLFKEFWEECKDIKEFSKKFLTHKTQFRFNEVNIDCYNIIYKGLKDVVPRQSLFSKISKLKEECSECYKFYMQKKPKSIFGLDYQLGKKFEEKLLKFLRKKGISCEKGDSIKKYPDNRIINSNGKIVAYFEVKFQSTPWLWAYKEEGSNRECYEGSPALDIKKLKQQRELSENEIKVPIFYVYILDFPCVKGIFYVSAEKMYEYFDKEAIAFERKDKEGDFKIIKGKKIKKGQTSKIHPSIFMMKNFEDMIDEFKQLSENV